MDFKVSKSQFVKSLGLVGGVAAGKTAALPILGNVLIETSSKDSIHLTGTDLEVGISTTLAAQVEEEGSITVPSKKFFDIVRELPEDEVEITVAKNNAVNIKSGKAFFKIMGLGKEDYPKLPTFDEKDAIEIEQATVKEGFSLTSCAMSNDGTRYVLNGILISIKGKKIHFVATDGRRLAFVEKELNQNQKPYEMIIPSKAIQELLKILTWDGTLKIIPTQNQTIFHFGETFLVSRLIEGKFPNYEQVIPKEETTTSETNREELLRAVRRASLLTSNDSPAVKFDFIKGKMLISSRSPNLGESKEELAAKIDGKELTIGFNPNYLADALKSLDIDKVSISLSDSDKPGLLKGKEGYLYVIMPMQLN